jgi:membrane-associated phospholipid phosphatase
VSPVVTVRSEHSVERVVALIDLHQHPPMTLRRLRARYGWILPLTAVLFVLLAVGARFDELPWDAPIFDAVVDARTPWLVSLARRVSFLGSTPVVLTVAALAALLAWRRCPRLALAIVVIAAARPLAEWAIKELVNRERPTGARLVRGTGPSFPSGHPLATAASWGLLPLVAALYTKRRVVWWSIAIGVWTLAVLVAASRVVLGVHWPSDVVGSLLLAIIGVAVAEQFVDTTHSFGGRGGCGPDQANASFNRDPLRPPRGE